MWSRDSKTITKHQQGLNLILYKLFFANSYSRPYFWHKRFHPKKLFLHRYEFPLYRLINKLIFLFIEALIFFSSICFFTQTDFIHYYFLIIFLINFLAPFYVIFFSNLFFFHRQFYIACPKNYIQSFRT